MANRVNVEDPGESRGIMSFYEDGVTYLTPWHTYVMAIETDEGGTFEALLDGAPPFVLALPKGKHAPLMSLVVKKGDGRVDGRPFTLKFTGKSGKVVESKYAIVNDYTSAYQEHQDRQGRASRRRTAERDGTVEVWRASNRGLDRFPVRESCFAGAPEAGIRAFRELYLDLNALPPNTLLSGTQALEPIFTPAAIGILQGFNSYWLLRVAAEASRVQEKTSGQSLPINEASIAAALTALKADKNVVAAQELAAKSTSNEVRSAILLQGGLTLLDVSGAEPKLVDNPVFA